MGSALGTKSTKQVLIMDLRKPRCQKCPLSCQEPPQGEGVGGEYTPEAHGLGAQGSLWEISNSGSEGAGHWMECWVLIREGKKRRILLAKESLGQRTIRGIRKPS